MAIDDLMTPRRHDGGGTRRSGGRAIAFWIVALVAGSAAALLLRFYIERSAQPSGPALAKVVVAAADLPIATTLKPEHVKLTDWPEAVQPPGAIREPKDLIGRVVLAKVYQGEPILNSKLATKDAGRGLAALIPESMRAMAVRVDDVVGVAGFVHPDDRVDVIVTIQPPRPADAEPTSKLILQNVKVLAVGKELDVPDQGRAQAMPVTVATLLVSPEESEKLALAASHGRILLTLRNWADRAPVETVGTNATALLAGTDVTGRARLAAVVPAPSAPSDSRRPRRATHVDSAPAPPPVAATPQKEVVEILRGDRLEERKFDVKDKQ